MKILKLLKTATFISLFALNAHADSFFKYGVGVFNSAKDSKAETKVFSLGYSEKFFQAMMYQLEAGAWIDNRKDLDRKSSGFGFGSIGLDVQTGAFYIQALWGAGLITCTDSMLGGPFQFNTDLGIGLRDSNGYSIGIGYKHISSAGIELPNKGRDFMMMRLAVPF